MNKEKSIIWFFAGILAVLLQLWISPIFRISSLRPDFIMIYVILFGLAFNKKSALTVGFFMGAVQDILGTGSFLGLSMLSKTITGFLSSQMKEQVQKSNPVFSSLFLLLIAGIHFMIYLWFYLRDFKYGFVSLSLKYIFPYTLYNGIFLLIIYFMLNHEEE